MRTDAAMILKSNMTISFILNSFYLGANKNIPIKLTKAITTPKYGIVPVKPHARRIPKIINNKQTFDQ
jgi:hypothetical protein